MIILESVSKSYQGNKGRIVALDCIDFKIGNGEFVVIRGPSGSGKTTLLVLIAGMLRPSGGEVIIDQQRLSDLSAEGRALFRARNIGFVFQMFHLVPYLNAVENVMLATTGVEADQLQARALLGKLDLEEKVSHLPAQLSAGEKQRIAVARALINQPKVVLADEPTGNLDPDNARTVFSYLSDFHRQGGTVVVASHDDFAEDFADRVVTLQKGRIIDENASHSGQ